MIVGWSEHCARATNSVKPGENIMAKNSNTKKSAVSNWTVPAKQRPVPYVWSIQDFIKYAPLIDSDPIGQRLAVEDDSFGQGKPSKNQMIVNSIFRGSDIGEIKLADIRNEGGKFHFESIDGGHRKRCIVSFIKGEFPLHKTSILGEKYFGELTDEQRDYFLNYTFRVVVFSDMSAAEKGQQFRDTNTTTAVNHQEMLNSFGNIPIANAVRSTARHVRGIGTAPHDLFFCNLTPAGKMSYKNVAFDNSRLRIDEIVARIFCIVYNGKGGLTSAAPSELQAMYEDPNLDEATVKQLQKRVEDVLDFILEITNSRKFYLKNPITNKELVLLYRLYFHYNEKYGKWKLVDPDLFLKKFKTAMDKFDKKNPSKFAQGTFVLDKKNNGEDGSARLIYEAFHSYLGEHKIITKARQTIEWIEQFFDPFKDESAIVIDKKRVFGQDEIESALIRQMFKDPITGKDLTMHDAVGGHVVAHSKGGKTTANNLMTISRKVNSEMGAMDAREYAATKKK
jgi:hypothetical protein